MKRAFVISIVLASAVVLQAQQRRGAAPPAAPAPLEQNWRVWGGPQRDFLTTAKGLFPPGDKWLSTPPRKVWERPLGDGYSPIAVEDGVLYTGYRRYDNDVIVALNAETGATIWEYAYAAPFRNAYAAVAAGPYAMPQVIGDRVVTASAIGQVHSLDKKTGKPVWSFDVERQADGDRLPHGYSSHALPYKDSLIVLAGGSGKGVLRLRQSDGGVVWQKLRFDNAYSSPLLIDVDGQPQVVLLVADRVIGIDPETGGQLWEHPHEPQYGIAVSTPVWAPGNVLFISAAYGVGARAFKLTRSGATTQIQQLWYHPRLQSHFGTVIRDGGFAYLSSGQSVGIMTGVELATGRVTWQARDFVKAQLLAADGRLIILDEDGNLGLGIATPEKFQAIAKWPMLSSVAWTPPTLAGDRLFLRDRKVIMALDLRTIR
jgi:outer membrane protein assembly factor BamB